jgi:hypothetical protein
MADIVDKERIGSNNQEKKVQRSKKKEKLSQKQETQEKQKIPKSRKKLIPQAVRTAVWNTYIGIKKGVSHCFVGCGNIISQHNFECGHVQAEASNGETTIPNLRPICPNCNKSMGTQNMEEFISEYGFHKHKNWNADFTQNKTCNLL